MCKGENLLFFIKRFVNCKNSATFATHFRHMPVQCDIRGVAQLVSAPALGAGGHKFESCYPDGGEKVI